MSLCGATGVVAIDAGGHAGNGVVAIDAGGHDVKTMLYAACELYVSRFPAYAAPYSAVARQQFDDFRGRWGLNMSLKIVMMITVMVTVIVPARSPCRYLSCCWPSIPRNRTPALRWLG